MKFTLTSHSFLTALALGATLVTANVSHAKSLYEPTEYERSLRSPHANSEKEENLSEREIKNSVYDNVRGGYIVEYNRTVWRKVLDLINDDGSINSDEVEEMVVVPDKCFVLNEYFRLKSSNPALFWEKCHRLEDQLIERETGGLTRNGQGSILMPLEPAESGSY